MNNNYDSKNIAIAELLLPDIKKTPEVYEKMYPQRNLPEGAIVTRFAPSPTGFLHIGSLYASLIEKRSANQTGGVFYLRIEDTDKKREVENGVELLAKGLIEFGIDYDEGMLDENNEKGNYGPYKQSSREEIYKTFIKELVKKGLAYPCFCAPEELEKVREEQEKLGVRPGYHGKWASHRNITLEEVEKNIEEGRPFVVRLKSSGVHENSVKFIDLIKGEIEMAENDQDAVILKSDGLPVYHSAHVIDDHLMRTTHAVRGDEWLPSTPLHLELFKAFGWEPPKYVHVAPIMKLDGTSKRKFSKRKDPEANVAFYYQEGYTKEAVLEYLLTIANSNYEEWRTANPHADNKNFAISFDKMSASGALFDLNKLLDISKNVIAFMSAEEVYNKALNWANEYDKELHEIMNKYEDYTKAVLNIERTNEKPRKDLAKWSDVKDSISYFYNELFDKAANYEMPERLSEDNVKEIIKEYLTQHNTEVDKQVWFENLKSMADKLGYAKDMKEFKKNPEAFKGNVADVAMTIRVALTKRKNTPDLYETMKVMGNKMVQDRLQLCVESV